MSVFQVESTKKVTSLVILSKADQLVPLMGSIEACVAPSFWFYEIVCTFFCNRECEVFFLTLFAAVFTLNNE